MIPTGGLATLVQVRRVEGRCRQVDTDALIRPVCGDHCPRDPPQDLRRHSSEGRIQAPTGQSWRLYLLTTIDLMLGDDHTARQMIN